MWRWREFADERLDAVLYTAFAGFAVVTSALSTVPSHRHWGGAAVFGYTLGAVAVGVMYLARNHLQYAARQTTRIVITVFVTATTALYPMLMLIRLRAAGVPGTDLGEVRVTERTATHLLTAGTPYNDMAHLTTTHLSDSFDPYLPAMTVFGLPRAIWGPGVFTDARLFFAATAIVLLLVAIKAFRTRRLAPAALLVLTASPLVTLPMATGGDDLPLLGMLLLGCALIPSRPTAAGVVVGIAAAMKFTAWPVAIVLGLAIVAYHGRAGIWRYASAALAVLAVVVIPFALIDPAAMASNVIAYPLGMAHVHTPAASPMLGYFIANSLPHGRTIATGLLLITGLIFSVYFLRRPPQTVADATRLAALGLAVGFLLAPASRFGYFIYPVVLGAWYLLERNKSPASPLATIELNSPVPSVGNVLIKT